MNVARDNLHSLTGLRFIAAFAIVLGHIYQPWLEITAIGMPLFFTLSGFVIHYVYADAFAGGWGQATGKFAIARFSRIYPLYLTLLLYTLLRGPMGPSLATAEGFPILLAYLAGYWTWYPFTIEGGLLLDWYYHISWSVSTELFFYTAYAAVLYRIARVRNAKRCFALLIGFCVAAYLVFYVAYMARDIWESAILQQAPQFVGRTVNFNNSFYRWLLYVSPYSRIFEFIAGCLVCQLYRLVRREPSLRDRLPTGAIAWLAIAAIVMLFVPFRYLGEHNPWLAVGNHSFGGYLVSLHMNFLFAPACSALIFALAIGGSAVDRVLSSRVCRSLGDISYSTYLSHPNAERVLMHAGFNVMPALPHILAIMAVVYSVSWLLYALVEVPAKAWIRQITETGRLSPPPLFRRV